MRSNDEIALSFNIYRACPFPAEIVGRRSACISMTPIFLFRTALTSLFVSNHCFATFLVTAHLMSRQL